ncbi:MAG TPA: fibronectin type III domain-containing protein [Nitrospira sp.]|nr:fibronectin type III domain-containing protein [Nitrospira sp.]
MISSLSTPAETPSVDPSVDDVPSNPSETESPSGEDVIATSTDDLSVSGDEEFDLAASVVDPAELDPAEQEKMAISMIGATARVTWDASSDPNVQGYFIHYGKQSSGQHGSCSYEESQRVGPPPATITGLEPNTPYFFAISAFGESESESETPCSNEIIVVTSAAQS